MKFLEVIAAVVALLIDAFHEWQRRKEIQHNEDIANDPAGELRDRGWMQPDASDDGMPTDAADGDSDTHD